MSHVDIEAARVLEHAGWRAVAGPAPLDGGWLTSTSRFTTADGRQHSLRLYPPSEDPLADLHREETALRVARAAGLPVATVEASGCLESRAYLILEWLPGLHLIKVMETRPWLFPRLGEALGRLQGGFHAAPAVEPRFREMSWADLPEEPALAAAVKEVAVEDAFCHLDFHPLNVLGEPSGITGIVDFASCGIADRRADIGRTLAILDTAPLPPSPTKTLQRLLRRRFAAAWERGYCSAAGTLPRHPLFEAWGAATLLRDMRLAVEKRRGWVTLADVERLQALVAKKKRVAGIS